MNKKERKKERKRKMRKKEKIWVCIKIKWTPQFSKCIRKFEASRLKDPYSFSNHVQSDNEDFLSSVCIFLFPLLDITLFSNDLFDESR
jgi:hypothetical protein